MGKQMRRLRSVTAAVFSALGTLFVVLTAIGKGDITGEGIGCLAMAEAMRARLKAEEPLRGLNNPGNGHEPLD